MLLGVSPILLLGGLAASGALVDRLGGGGRDTVLGAYLAFVIGWLSVSPVLAYPYQGLAPGRPGTRALLWEAVGTGSMLAGTALGFVLFLALGIDLGGAHGGVPTLANGVAAFDWLFVQHVIVLVGYVTTLCLDAREGHPLAGRSKATRWRVPDGAGRQHLTARSAPAPPRSTRRRRQSGSRTSRLDPTTAWPSSSGQARAGHRAPPASPFNQQVKVLLVRVSAVPLPVLPAARHPDSIRTR